MRKGLLCSLAHTCASLSPAAWALAAFLVGPAWVEAQHPNAYFPTAGWPSAGWPSAAPTAVQGYGYYQAPSANQGYQYQQYQYQYQPYQYPQYSYPYWNGYQYQYPTGYPQAQGYSNGTSDPANSSITANRMALPGQIGQETSQSVEPAQPMVQMPPSATPAVPMPSSQLLGLPDFGPDPAEIAQPPAGPVESIARLSVAHNCVWGALDYIMAWTKHDPTPPLVTTGFPGDVSPGALGQPGTQVLFGGPAGSLAFGNPISGVRAQIGVWLDPENRFSLDLNGIVLPTTYDKFALASNAVGSPAIARPVFDTATGTENAYITALPGSAALFIPPLAAGSTTIRASEFLWGLDLNARYHAYLGRYLHAEALAGFRYLRLVENLNIQDQVTPLQPGAFSFLGMPLPAGTTIFDQDSFRTSNQFTGFQLGGRLRWDFGRYFFDLNGKAAVGANQEQVLIAGVTNVPGFGAAPGGILAQPSNIGNHTRTQVSFLPEVGINAGVNLTSWCRLQAGYNFLYWSNVVRPGEEINRRVNPNQVPTDQGFGVTAGPPQPTFAFHESSFWVQYINLGLELHY